MSEQNHLIVIGSRTYDVLAVPDQSSAVVEASVEDLTRSLSIDTLVQDIDRVNALLYLAYVGVSDHGALRASVFDAPVRLPEAMRQGDGHDGCLRKLHQGDRRERAQGGSLSLYGQGGCRRPVPHALCLESTGDV